ncbi:MAG: tripartite tricarboxylate transporter substrate binding protein [Proteobacteria bacterium]|nr:tripartite tricarboxylate transporter substrate binding protein [Pseudomonadota bacterium]
MPRATTCFGLALGLVSWALAAPVQAQSFGSAPITLVMPYPPGGLGDFFARTFGPKLGESIGATVIVDNRPGANGSIGTAMVARARPDGHMIAFVPASTLTTNQWLIKDMTFDPIKDLTPLAETMVVPNALVVHPSLAAKTVPELFALARTKPGGLNFASMGIGSSGHLQGVMMSAMANLQMVHVAYKGSGPALQDLIAGRVEVMFDNLPSVMPFIQSGQVRALAVTSAEPAPQAPDVPPVGKFLPGFEATPWFGIVGPAGMSKDLVATLNAHIVRAAKSPEVVSALEARGARIVTSSAEDFGKLIRDEAEQMRHVIKNANITLD